MSIRDALDALPQATPGPWKAELCLGGSYVIDNTLPETRGKVRRIAEVYGHLSTPSDARLIAAAPDLVDEVIRLKRKRLYRHRTGGKVWSKKGEYDAITV